MTEWNKEQKLQGRTDVPLCAEGRQMAREAAARYKDVHFDICYCSPLMRARETAALVLDGRNIPVIIDDRLTEMGFGIYEGIENVFDKPECPVWTLFFEPEKYVAQDGAESLNDLIGRTKSFLEEIVYPGVGDGKDILIMGHGAMNSALIGQVRHTPVKDFWAEGIENCKLIKLI